MKGAQQPRIKIEPPRSGTDGKGAAMLMQEYGVTLDTWQRLVLDSWLGTDADGDYTTVTAGLSCPRQNGKTEILLARCFYGLCVTGERILFTAHQMRCVKSMFRRLVQMFSDRRHPEITGTVKHIRFATGEEAIEMKNGGLIQFMSRSRQAARGFDGISLVVLDEAAEVTDEQLEAIMAVLSASATGTRQIIYAGTPTYVGCTGEVFRRFRQACIVSAGKGEVMKSSWHEWGMAAENLQDVDISDKKLWYECNPALGTRLTLEFTEEEYRMLDAAGFARERLGWWANPPAAKTELAIDAALWDSCKSDEERPEGKIAYGVKFTPDGAEVVLAAAVIPDSPRRGSYIGVPGTAYKPPQPSLPEGKARISLIAIEPTGNGLQWLADWLNARYKKAACVVIDGKNGADVLIEKLRPTGGGAWMLKDSITKPKAADIVTAAGMLVNDINEHTITWYSQQEELRESAITATKRPISGGWGFGGQTSAPIEACSLALWGCRTSKRNPQRQMRIG